MNHPDAVQVLLAIDQLANTLLAGYADESLSARAYRLYRDRGRGLPMRLINALFFWQSEHCRQAYESEIKRTQLPPEYRTD